MDISPAIRHVLRDNAWELKCPLCFRDCRVTKDEFEGRAPFPAHPVWVLPWEHRVIDQWPSLTHWRRMRRAINWLDHQLRWPRLSRCEYRTAQNWRAWQWPSQGASPFGPL